MAYKKPNNLELAKYFNLHRNTVGICIKDFKKESGSDLSTLEGLMWFMAWMKRPMGKEKT